MNVSGEEDGTHPSMEDKGFQLTQLEIGQQWRSVPTSIWEAARQGEVDKIMMITLSRTDANKCNLNKETPLHHACDGPTTTVLLKCGAMYSINARDKLGKTPLMWAAIYGLEEKAKILLRHGANPTLKDKNEKTAEYFANSRKHWTILEIVRESTRRWKIGTKEVSGGILGESERDTKARMLDEDSKYERSAALKTRGCDRNVYPSWMRNGVWTGAFEKYLGDEHKRLLKHYSLWTVEEVSLFLATNKEIDGLDDNVYEYCKRIKETQISGAILHGLPRDKLSELFSSLGIPVHHRRRIVSSLADLKRKQSIINFPGRKEEERMPYVLPIGLGKLCAFKIIGTYNWAVNKTWTQSNISSLSRICTGQQSVTHYSSVGSSLW